MTYPPAPAPEGVRVLELPHLIAGPTCRMSVAAQADGGPALGRAAVVDTIGGLLASQGILTALIARSRTGEGQRVDVSLLDGALLSHLARLSVFHETGVPIGRYGSGHPNLVPYQAFRASDGWIFLAVWK